MNEKELRGYATRHSAAIMAGEVDRIVDDLADRILGRLPTIVALLPRPLTRAQIIRIAPGPGGGVTDCRYSSPDGDKVTIRSVWKIYHGRARIIDIKAVF